MQRCKLSRPTLSPSTISRIETGHHRIALDELVPTSRALGTTLEELGEAKGGTDVVIRPQPGHSPGQRTWILSDGDVSNWGERTILARPGDAAEFYTMDPHAM